MDRWRQTYSRVHPPMPVKSATRCGNPAARQGRGIPGAGLDAISTRPLQALAYECWRLDRLADDYRRFIARFAPAIKSKPARGRNAAQHFLLRTPLIHEFRRVQFARPG